MLRTDRFPRNLEGEHFDMLCVALFTACFQGRFLIWQLIEGFAIPSEKLPDR
jgi:hypothetical protein